MLDVVVCFLLLVVGLNVKNWFTGFNAYDRKFLNYLFFWHLIIGAAYCYNVSDGTGDAYTYWFAPQNQGWRTVMSYINRGSASGYVYLLNYYPAHVLNLSFFTGSMMYMVLGYVGFVYLYKIIKVNVPRFLYLRKVKILWIPVFPYFLFLPNLHYWTCGIGKDTLLFFSCVIFMYALSHFRKRFLYIVVAVLISIFIRPHILLYLFLAFGTAAVLDGRLKVYKKVILCLLFLGGSFYMFPYVAKFARIEDLQSESISAYSNQHITKLSKARTTSSLDLTSAPYPVKVFTFLFRPLFFDLPGALAMLASLENLLYLLFFVKVLFSSPLAAYRLASVPVKSMVVFFILGSITFPLILGNLGIMLRQKTPFMIMFLVFGFLVLVRAQLKKKPLKRRIPQLLLSDSV